MVERKRRMKREKNDTSPFPTILKSLTEQAVFNIILSYTHVHVNSSFIFIGSMNIP